jgi:dTDP-4-dehydrorhamnose 3,5-epimerase
MTLAARAVTPPCDLDVEETALPGLLLLKPRVFSDRRGCVFEGWSAARYAAAGVPSVFAQDNVSRSRVGVLRGLHLQHPFAQGKLVCAVAGEIYDVALDLRRGSPTFGRWTSVMLDEDSLHQLYVPPGVAHGFCALRDGTLVTYKCTEAYHPEAELGVRWDDPDLGIPWPIAAPLVSEKDARLPRLRDVPPSSLPRFR